METLVRASVLLVVAGVAGCAADTATPVDPSVSSCAIRVISLGDTTFGQSEVFSPGRESVAVSFRVVHAEVERLVDVYEGVTACGDVPAIVNMFMREAAVFERGVAVLRSSGEGVVEQDLLDMECAALVRYVRSLRMARALGRRAADAASAERLRTYPESRIAACVEVLRTVDSSTSPFRMDELPATVH